MEALEGNNYAAESLYRKALLADPKNISAINFYAILLMKERRYTEAQKLYAALGQLLPDDVWVQRAWQDAVDGQATDAANRLADEEEWELAANLYRRLIAASPDDPARYLPLGQMYANLQLYCCALETFHRGLLIDPEAWYLWRAIGFTYILMEEFCTAQNIFATLLEEDPKDAESWAGLGRIQALDGSICLAEQYYARALEIAPTNITALSFLSDLLLFENWYFSALEVYDTLYDVAESNQSDACEPVAKWIRRGYNKLLNLTCPTIAVGGQYHEEDQWDPTEHRWAAMYQVYGVKSVVNFPICDGLTMWGSAADQFFILRDLENQRFLYCFDVQRGHIGARLVYNSCFFIDAKAGLSSYSRYRRAMFRAQTGTIAEPSLTMTYQTPKTIASLAYLSNSDLVARNFKRNNAKMVGYYTLAATLQRKIMRRGWLGLEADGILYRDYVSNSSERALAWFQWRPPFYADNILFRYSVKYQTFAKNIPDYYTYKPQIVNQLQLTLEKLWRVCWADSLYTSLSYSHGWQNTRTKFPQIIVIAPTTGKLPYVWDNRQFNTVVGTLIYTCGQLQLTLAGDYYRDTKKYTMFSVAADLGWRF